MSGGRKSVFVVWMALTGLALFGYQNCSSMKSNSSNASVAEAGKTGLHITVEPQPKTIDEGEPFQMKVGFSGASGTVIFQWFHNGKLISVDVNSTANKHILEVAESTGSDEGNYFVVIKDDDEAVTSQVAFLAVKTADGEDDSSNNDDSNKDDSSDDGDSGDDDSGTGSSSTNSHMAACKSSERVLNVKYTTYDWESYRAEMTKYFYDIHVESSYKLVDGAFQYTTRVQGVCQGQYFPQSESCDSGEVADAVASCECQNGGFVAIADAATGRVTGYYMVEHYYDWGITQKVAEAKSVGCVGKFE